MSKIQIVWRYITGGPEAVLTYALERVNALLGEAVDNGTADIPALARTAADICGTLDACAWMISARRRTAWTATIRAARAAAAALGDGQITRAEVAEFIAECDEAVAAWRA